MAIRIMESWYERNHDHPYPSYDTAEVMARSGGVTVEQVTIDGASRPMYSLI
jgi:hypothetical protein